MVAMQVAGTFVAAAMQACSRYMFVARLVHGGGNGSRQGCNGSLIKPWSGCKVTQTEFL